jgi:GNAT superfamily N-acetyltransferase
MIAYTVRPAQPHDVENLVELCAEHAAFERAPYDARGKTKSLTAALFGTSPKVWAWVATIEDKAVGYSTATEEFSTWSAAPYLHMDCLFVRPGHRDGGIGAALMGAVLRCARERSLPEVQWQTPVWNSDAHRFYLRSGATAHEKNRYSLPIE